MKGFSQPRHVQGRASIADLFPVSKRCGVYILHFSDGEIYAGKALDVTRRYIEHRNVHRDIEDISFKCVTRGKLDEEERTLIRTLERDGHRLRNIIYTSIPGGESDFDLIMSQQRQERWLKDPKSCDLSGTRVIDRELRRKYSKTFARFAAMPRASEVTHLLNQYVQAGIPVPLQSEVSFWSCSCLPAGATVLPGEKVYARVNLYWQVVLTVSDYRDDVECSFHLALSPLVKAFGEALSLLFKRFPAVRRVENVLEPGGQDQINLYVRGAGSAAKFMEHAEIRSAIRLFNLRLMKKGPSAYSRYHCLELADSLVCVP